MSRENLEIVRSVYESLLRRDWNRIAELVDPNVEHHGTVGGLEEGHLGRGVREIRQVFEEEDDEIWDEHRIVAEDLIDAGDQVVVLQREYQRGRGSGVELVIDTAAVFDVRDGHVVRIQGYMDRAKALEAVGLRE